MRSLAPLASLLALVVVSTSSTAQLANVDACSLLTAAEAGKAIDVPVDKGQHLSAASKGECLWSDVPTADINHRRVTLSLTPQAAFDRMKASPVFKTEPAPGVGDDAFYAMPKGSGPILVAKKGGACFQIKILNGLKAKPLSADEVKARELALGKAAASRL